MMNRIFRLDKFTGWHMIAVMGMFFGAIIAVNLTLAWHANRSWTGLVVGNTYVASQNFNEETAKLNSQMNLNWHVEPNFQAREVSLELINTQSEIIYDAIITAKIGHPTNENSDSFVQFIHSQDGTYRAETDLDVGLWDANISIIGPNGQNWTKSYRFIIKAAP